MWTEIKGGNAKLGGKDLHGVTEKLGEKSTEKKKNKRNGGAKKSN